MKFISLLGARHQLVKASLYALFVVSAYLVLLGSFLGFPDTPISGDAIGYYEPLPSFFIHEDLFRTSNEFITHERLNQFEGVYNKQGGYMYNKYPVGTAILQAPFFLSSFVLLDDGSSEGYSMLYQNTIWIACLFYLFFALVFAHLLFKSFGLSDFISFALLLLVVFATPVLVYAGYSAGYSHVYSLFAISGFCLFARKYFLRPQMKYLYLAAVWFGVVVLIRQVNIFAIFLIPLLASSKAQLRLGLQWLSENRWASLGAFGSILVLQSIQLFVWHAQTGKWFIYSYGDEGFDFLNPAFWEVLFSYRKGLFVYTPILFLIFLVVLYQALNASKRFVALSWLLFFALFTYVMSSWWCWWYGCTYGQRVYVDFLVILVLPLGFALEASRQWWKRLGFVLVSSFLVVVNVIQANQFQRYILHCGDMDAIKYWNVFLKTDEKYEGLFWEIGFEESWYRKIYDRELGDIEVPRWTNDFDLITEKGISILKEKGPYYFQVSFDNEFSDKHDASLILGVLPDGSDKFSFWHHFHKIKLATDRFGKMQQGVYQCIWNPEKDGLYTLRLSFSSSESELLENFRLQIFEQNE